MIKIIRLFHDATEVFGHCFNKVFLSFCESLACKTLGLPLFLLGFPGGSVVNNLPANTEDTGLIPGSGTSPGQGNGSPLQYSYLGNHRDIVAGVKVSVFLNFWAKTSSYLFLECKIFFTFLFFFCQQALIALIVYSIVVVSIFSFVLNLYHFLNHMNDFFKDCWGLSMRFHILYV